MQPKDAHLPPVVVLMARLSGTSKPTLVDAGVTAGLLVITANGFLIGVFTAAESLLLCFVNSGDAVVAAAARSSSCTCSW